jgi:zinc protease
MKTRTSRIALAAVCALACMQRPTLLEAQSWPSSSPPRPLPSRDATFPPYELHSLPNGMAVVVVVHREQPAVSLKVIVRGGPAQDPTDKPGVASMVAALLDQGTTTRTAQQLADAIDSAGGKLEAGIGRDLTYVNVTIMKDGLDLGMALMADVVRRPAFSPEELERQRQQFAGALRVSYEDPGYLADVAFDRIVYGAHPYGSPGDGTPASIARLTRDDLVAFHRRYFAPNNCLLAVVGDVAAVEAMAAVTKAFGDWPRQDVQADPVVSVPRPSRRVVVLDKPGTVQTEIRVGHAGIPRKSGDYMAVNLAVRVLGGAGVNRLQRVLRTERGLTYGAKAELEALRLGGQVAAQTSTRSAATGEVLRLMVDEIARLRREGVRETELGDAKAYLTGSFPLTIETPEEIATQVLTVLFYDLPVNELQTFRQRVGSVSVGDVEWAAARYLEADRLTVVLVGDASIILDQLRRAGFRKVEVVPLAELDLSQPDLRQKPVQATSRGTPPGRAPGGFFGAALRPAAFKVTRSGAAPEGRSRRQFPSIGAPKPPASAAALVDTAIAALGGLEKLRAVKTLQAVARSTFNSPQGPVTMETTTYLEYPNRLRVEARLPIGQVVQVFAGGDDVWVKDPNKGIVVPPEQVRTDFRNSVQRDVLTLLLRAQAGQLTMALEEPGSGPDASRTVYGLRLSAPDLEPVTLSIDVGTGLVVKESYPMPGGAGTAEESFSDYRDVGGVKIAHRASLRRAGLLVLTRSVTSVRVNAPIDPSLFVRPDKVQ